MNIFNGFASDMDWTYYFEWLCRIICNERKYYKYCNLLNYLYSTEFTYTLPQDINRANDGLRLRTKYGINNSEAKCSVLEMMIALSARIEEDIMSDSDCGNRTGIWFWKMIESLGLSNMDNNNFDADHAAQVIQTFLNREYSWNGAGGLFTLQNPRQDMRTLEIWYQMCGYLNEINT